MTSTSRISKCTGGAREDFDLQRQPGAENWQLAKGLLPPEILRLYEKSEYSNPIVDYPAGYGG